MVSSRRSPRGIERLAGAQDASDVAQRVLPITEDIMFKWRLLVEDGRKVGHTFSQPDLIIAATALHHGLTVVTRDVSDHQKARAPVLNPWLDATPAASTRSG
jgi:toxin FitB